MAEKGYVVKSLYEIFDFSISTNSGLTKTFVNEHKGNIPVYGASQDAEPPSYGYIQDNISGVKYFDNCLTYNKDGASGLVFYRQGHFTVSEKVVPLVLFDKYKDVLDYTYLKYAIENESRKTEYTFSKKATKTTFRFLKIRIPIDEKGEFDLRRQNILAERFAEVEERRKSLLRRIEELGDLAVRLPNNAALSWKDVACKELFTPTNGNCIYTKEYCKSHKGNIPLYSGNTEKEFDYVDVYDYEGEYLTWAKDGLAGYLMLHNGKFSLTGHRGILIPTEECKNIDLQYIKYVLEPIFRANKKGREGDLGKNEYTTLNSNMIKKIKETIPIPVLSDDSYDFNKQKELAGKYEQIEGIKKSLREKIIEVTNVVVN